METTARRNILDVVLDEYVAWGGPIVQRRVALADMQSRGFDAKAIDISVFGRQAVEAPENPEAHLAFFRQIQALEDKEPAGDGGCADESPNYARAQRINRAVPGWQARK